MIIKNMREPKLFEPNSSTFSMVHTFAVNHGSHNGKRHFLDPRFGFEKNLEMLLRFYEFLMGIPRD